MLQERHSDPLCRVCTYVGDSFMGDGKVLKNLCVWMRTNVLLKDEQIL